MHRTSPAEILLQSTALPEALLATPVAAVPLTRLRSVAEYVKSHWTDAGGVPPAFRLTARATLVPGAPDAPETEREVWPAALTRREARDTRSTALFANLPKTVSTLVINSLPIRSRSRQSARPTIP